MDINKEHILKEIDKLSDEELHQFLADADVSSDYDLLLAYREACLKEKAPMPDVGKAWERFHDRHIAPEKAKKAKIWAMVRTAAAVAAVFALIIGVYLYEKPKANDPMLAFVANDAPKEVLIGTDGDEPQNIKTISSASGVILKEGIVDYSHISVKKSQSQTISTPRGKAFKVVLPDGSTVILNADSKLIFPTHFAGDKREVKLIGEAYFNITKDPNHPFIVASEKLKTRVLGTEFNMNAYPGSDAKVTLISGSVVVNNVNNNQEVTLKPGENVTLLTNNNFDVTTVDTEYYTQWKDGYFYFDNVALIDIVRELGRWYNINIQINDNSLMSYRLHFIADRNASIDQVVQNLNELNYLSAVRQGNKLILSKKTERKYNKN